MIETLTGLLAVAGVILLPLAALTAAAQRGQRPRPTGSQYRREGAR